VNSIEQNQSTALASPVAERKPGKPAKPEKIRAELNIEKWPAIWQPASSKSQPVTRVLERETSASDGRRITSRLEVGFTQHGTVTTEDQKMFYALVRQWEESGKPSAQVFFSGRLLQRLLKKNWGTNVLDAITGSLRRLRTTPFTWTRSYHKSDAPKTSVEEETFFTMLADLKIVRRKTDGHVTNQQGYFQFDKNILENLLANYTKPLFLEDLFRFRSEIAQLLYVHVDLILAGKTTYERRTKELFDDLGLRGESYRFPSNRKQVLNRALKELQGVRLSTGILKSAVLERTKDEQDYKIVFRKGAIPISGEATQADSAEFGHLIEAAAAPVVVNHYAAPKESSAQRAEDLLRHFYKVFHGVDSRHPQAKESSQALTLISQYGWEAARHVVNFAKIAAVETGFHIQTFGGVLQYTSRAVGDLDRIKLDRSRTPICPRDRALQVTRPEEKRYERGERLLGRLSPEQYDRHFERARVELFREQPFLDRIGKQGSSLVTRSIRSRMVRQLEDEAMDLMPIDPGFAARYPWLFCPAQNLPL